ncbi:hypothetical protein [Halorubellus litoreus]|uniref:Uncharacterized protein n=1 Tax=Halorubellus litoreus TaxID=755308 RepID=A0ABD5VH03_9EURY
MTGSTPDWESSLADLPAALEGELSERERAALLAPEGGDLAGPSVVLYRRQATATLLAMLERDGAPVGRLVPVLASVLAREFDQSRQQRVTDLFNVGTVSRQICTEIVESLAGLDPDAVISTVQRRHAEQLFLALVPGTAPDRCSALRRATMEVLVALTRQHPDLIAEVSVTRRREVLQNAVEQLTAIGELPEVTANEAQRPTDYFVVKLVGGVAVRSPERVLTEAERDRVLSIASDVNSIEVQAWGLLSRLGATAGDATTDSATVERVLVGLCPPAPGRDVSYYDASLRVFHELLQLDVVPPQYVDAIVSAVRTSVVDRPIGSYGIVRVQWALTVLVELATHEEATAGHVDVMRSFMLELARESGDSDGDTTREVVASKLEALEAATDGGDAWYADTVDSILQELRVDDGERQRRALRAGSVLARVQCLDDESRTRLLERYCGLLELPDAPRAAVAVGIREVVGSGALRAAQFRLVFDVVRTTVHSLPADVAEHLFAVYQRAEQLTDEQASAAFDDLIEAMERESQALRDVAVTTLRTLVDHGRVPVESLGPHIEALCTASRDGIRKPARFDLVDRFVATVTLETDTVETIEHAVWQTIRPATQDEASAATHIEVRDGAGQACSILSRLLLAEHSLTVPRSELVRGIAAVCAHANDQRGDDAASHAIDAANRLLCAGSLSESECREVVSGLVAALRAGGARKAGAAAEALRAAVDSGVDTTTIVTDLLPLDTYHFTDYASHTNALLVSNRPRGRDSPPDPPQEDSEKWDAVVPLLETLTREDGELAADLDDDLRGVLADVGVAPSTRLDCVSVLSRTPAGAAGHRP